MQLRSNRTAGHRPGELTFLNAQSTDNFILQAEDTRIVDSMGGVEHREIRWRKATLDEAKAGVVAYHAQRNLAMTANFIVSDNDPRKFRSEQGRTEVQPGKDGLLEAKPVKDGPPEFKSEG